MKKKEKLETDPNTPAVLRRMLKSGDFAKLKGKAVRVLVVLLDHEAKGKQSPTVEKLAEKTGLSKKMVLQALHSLLEYGYITTEKRTVYIPVKE